MLDVERITEQEALLLERFLRVMNKQVPSGLWKGTGTQLVDELRIEAYKQEKAGARRMASILDTAANFIVLQSHQLQEARHFRNRGK